MMKFEVGSKVATLEDQGGIPCGAVVTVLQSGVSAKGVHFYRVSYKDITVTMMGRMLTLTKNAQYEELLLAVPKGYELTGEFRKPRSEPYLRDGTASTIRTGLRYPILRGRVGPVYGVGAQFCDGKKQYQVFGGLDLEERYLLCHEDGGRLTILGVVHGDQTIPAYEQAFGLKELTYRGMECCHD